jgi:predicted nuclease with TOPRIM domain
MNVPTLRLPADLQNRINEATQMLQDLSDQGVAVNAKIAEQNETLTRLQVENSTLAQENERIKGEYKELSSNLEALQGQVDAKKLDLQVAQDDIRNAQKVLADVQGETEAERNRLGNYVVRQRDVLAETEKATSALETVKAAWLKKKEQAIQALNTILE